MNRGDSIRFTDRPVPTPWPVLPDGLPARFSYEQARSEELHAQDRSAVYGMFHLYVLTG